MVGGTGAAVQRDAVRAFQQTRQREFVAQGFVPHHQLVVGQIAQRQPIGHVQGNGFGRMRVLRAALAVQVARVAVNEVGRQGLAQAFHGQQGAHG